MDLNVLLNLAIAVAVVGGILMLLNVAPIDATAKRIGTILILIVAVVWALRWLIGMVR